MRKALINNFAAVAVMTVATMLLPRVSSGAPALAPPVAVTITHANGDVTTVHGRDRVAAVEVFPGETVLIQAHLPGNASNRPQFAVPLDGGNIVIPLSVAPGGKASLSFQAAVQPGRYRLLLSVAGQMATLQFTVVNQ